MAEKPPRLSEGLCVGRWMSFLVLESFLNVFAADCECLLSSDKLLNVETLRHLHQPLASLHSL